MNGNDFIPLLGLTFEDPEVKRFLASCGMNKKPVREPDSYDAYLINKKLGLEITFTDEEDVEFRKRDYDEGELVLSNIRIYAAGSALGFAPFPGDFPHGLKRDSGLKDVQARLGRKPNRLNKDFAKARWDFDGYCLFVGFDESYKEIRTVAVQLPVG